MRKLPNWVITASLAAVLLVVLLAVDFYPAGIAVSRWQEAVVAICLAAGGYAAASAWAMRVLRNTEGAIRRVVNLAALVFVALLVIYVTLQALLTESVPGIAGRIPVGLAYSKEFHDLLPTNGNDATVTKEEFEYDGERIYAPWSVASSVLLLLSAWTLLFVSLALVFNTAVRMQQLQSRPVEFSFQQQGHLTLAMVTTTQGQLERTIRDRIPQQNMAVWRMRSTAVEGQVCRVEISDNPIGTGFLVGPSAVLTNYHVVEKLLDNSISVDKVAVRFDYKVVEGHARSAGTVVRLHPQNWHLDSAPYAPSEKKGGPAGLPQPTELDYALLLLEREIGREDYIPEDFMRPRRRGWLTLPDRLPLLSARDPLIIVQHPDGAPLKMAIDTEAFLEFNSNSSRMRYTTNTQPGSSGSPVFDFEWSLIALHHLGDPAFDALSAEYNQGIPADAIRRRIVDNTRPGAPARINAISQAI